MALHHEHVVASIKGEAGSKSGELAEALGGGKKIVVCTIQTFPFALKAVQELAATEGRRSTASARSPGSSPCCWGRRSCTRRCGRVAAAAPLATRVRQAPPPHHVQSNSAVKWRKNLGCLVIFTPRMLAAFCLTSAITSAA